MVCSQNRYQFNGKGAKCYTNGQKLVLIEALHKRGAAK